MEVRQYTAADGNSCLAVFDSNRPDYFAGGERERFEKFLAEPDSPYFVMEHESAVVGCGGFAVSGNSARLTWGMIRRQLHRRGLGRFLLLYRLREISRSGVEVETVGLDTTPLAAPFFLSQGFRVASTTPDGYGPGLDRMEMVKRLAVCA